MATLTFTSSTTPLLVTPNACSTDQAIPAGLANCSTNDGKPAEAIIFDPQTPGTAGRRPWIWAATKGFWIAFDCLPRGCRRL